MGTTEQKELPQYAVTTIHHKAQQLIGKYGFSQSDAEDIEQSLALDLIERLPNFNPAKATLNTFCARVIERQISKLIRHRKQGKRDYRRQSLSLDSHSPFGDESSSDYRESIEYGVAARGDEEDADLRIDVTATIARLPEDLKEIACRLRTESVAEVARDMDVPRTTLYGAIERIRLFFESAGLKAYL